MADRPSAPRKLVRTDVRTEFDRGAAELDDWLARFAWQNQRANNAVTYVSVLDGRVVGYYAIAVAGVGSDDAPPGVRKNAPRQVPCLLLARLAVDRSVHGRGLGRGLLADALRRTVGLAESVGLRALLVHARDQEAKAFYLAQAEFLESPTDPLHLLLPITVIAAMVTDAPP